MGTGRRVHVVVVALLLGALVTAPSVASAQQAPSAGWNDTACQPEADGPNPVVLLHGSFSQDRANFSTLAPALVATGRCVYSLNYGASALLPDVLGRPFTYPPYATAPIADSAAEIAAFVDDVLASTGADEVDLVGHSQGGFLALYVPKVLGRGDDIGAVVGLSPPTRGVASRAALRPLIGSPLTPLVLGGAGLLGCGACEDLAPGAAAVAALNDGPVGVPGVATTVIASTNDRLVTPEEVLVGEPGVTDVVVQDLCPNDPVGHIGLAFDPTVVDLVVAALDRRPPAATCAVGPPF